MARAIWKGRLVIGKEDLPVRMYSAIQDTKVHFHLLDKHGLAPVRQRIVRKTDQAEVAKDEQRKAFPLEAGRAVVFTAEELEELQPKESRDIEICRFVPRAALDDPWYDRPYYLGPDKDNEAKAYFALAHALASENVIGICRWVMRKSRYLGALTPFNGYLMMVTLRRAEQILSIPDVQMPQKPNPKELKLAAQLVDSIAGDFDPSAWQDEYHKRVCELIEAKEKGKKLHVHAPKAKRVSGGLAAALRQSLATAKREHAHG
jgi:DNA end-binding protein Ku